MTEHLCNSLGYSKQAYYKSLRADRGGEERERYVLSIVQDIRRDMPNLGVNKLWNMLGSNGLPVGRDWLYRLLHLHDLMIKQKNVKTPARRVLDRSSGITFCNYAKINVCVVLPIKREIYTCVAKREKSRV